MHVDDLMVCPHASGPQCQQQPLVSWTQNSWWNSLIPAANRANSRHACLVHFINLIQGIKDPRISLRHASSPKVASSKTTSKPQRNENPNSNLSQTLEQHMHLKGKGLIQSFGWSKKFHNFGSWSIASGTILLVHASLPGAWWVCLTQGRWVNTASTARLEEVRY